MVPTYIPYAFPIPKSDFFLFLSRRILYGKNSGRHYLAFGPFNQGRFAHFTVRGLTRNDVDVDQREKGLGRCSHNYGTGTGIQVTATLLLLLPHFTDPHTHPITTQGHPNRETTLPCRTRILRRRTLPCTITILPHRKARKRRPPTAWSLRPWPPLGIVGAIPSTRRRTITTITTITTMMLE